MRLLETELGDILIMPSADLHHGPLRIAEYLDAVLQCIDEMAGSVEQFLLETMQLTARELEYLRDGFTE